MTFEFYFSLQRGGLLCLVYRFCYRLDGPEFKTRCGQKVLLPQNTSRSALRSIQPTVADGVLSQWQIGRSIALTTHFHVPLRLRRVDIYIAPLRTVMAGRTQFNCTLKFLV
jgi:hypothetical protein